MSKAMSTVGTRVEFRNRTNIFKQKKAEIKALNNVSLTVEPGEIMGIIGYSGAGKSTLVRMINGLDQPTSGSVLLDGTDIAKMPESKLRGIRKNIGMIFQQFNLFTSRTAAGNIEYPLKLQGMGKAERQSAWRSCWNSSVWPTAAITTPNSFRVDKNSAWVSRVRWQPTRRFCLPMKPPPPSTPPPPGKSSTC